MIDVYEITFKDETLCQIKICQEDQNGKEIAESSVCFMYKENWNSAINIHVDNFLRKHPTIKAFEETRDQIRMIDVYKAISDDDSRITIDATRQVKGMDIIKRLMKK